tara:strand:+ start:923 stop:1318 length:396 start_codon:yes stop_codon:yes gene_type:complete
MKRVLGENMNKKRSMDSSKIVQHYMDAYNRRDVDDFLSFMHPDFESSLFDERRTLCMGLKDARTLYSNRFKENPDLFVTTLGRIANDNIVVDNQLIEHFDGGKTIRAISIFELEDGLVRRASFARRVVSLS